MVGILALIALMLNIINGAFGYVAYEAQVDPDTLAVDGVPLTDQSKEQLRGSAAIHALKRRLQ